VTKAWAEGRVGGFRDRGHRGIPPCHGSSRVRNTRCGTVRDSRRRCALNLRNMGLTTASPVVVELQAMGTERAFASAEDAAKAADEQKM
jgi:hypothetical protein